MSDHRTESQNSSPGISRRDFVLGAAGTAAGLILPSSERLMLPPQSPPADRRTSKLGDAPREFRDERQIVSQKIEEIWKQHGVGLLSAKQFKEIHERDVLYRGYYESDESLPSAEWDLARVEGIEDYLDIFRNRIHPKTGGDVYMVIDTQGRSCSCSAHVMRMQNSLEQPNYYERFDKSYLSLNDLVSFFMLPRHEGMHVLTFPAVLSEPHPLKDELDKMINSALGRREGTFSQTRHELGALLDKAAEPFQKFDYLKSNIAGYAMKQLAIPRLRYGLQLDGPASSQFDQPGEFFAIGSELVSFGEEMEYHVRQLLPAEFVSNWFDWMRSIIGISSHKDREPLKEFIRRFHERGRGLPKEKDTLPDGEVIGGGFQVVIGPPSSPNSPTPAANRQYEQSLYIAGINAIKEKERKTPLDFTAINELRARIAA